MSTGTTPASKVGYRPYIDGLRAIAVVAVILFHFGSPALAGGFIGVDVFFVISGFLITQLLSEPSTDSVPWQLAGFYVRRARRILPALLGTSLIVAVAGLIIYLPNDLTSLGRYLVFTSVMLGNLPTWQDGGYFATTGSYFVPLKHFWSLAVEEQFYVVYPIIFLSVARARPPWVTAALATIAIASMALCIGGEVHHSAALFYLMPARAWELMLGALAARIPAAWFNSRGAAECVVFTCLAIVLWALHAFGATTGFPNPDTAIPCAATALLLFIGRTRSTLATRLLSLRPLVFTGQISYSLYLWHVPILVFVQYFAIRELSAGELAALAPAIYGVAVLSWLFIENPVRRRILLKSDRALVVAATTGCLAIGALGAWYWSGRGLPWRFSRELQALTRPDAWPEDTTLCMTLPLSRVAAGDLCRYGSADAGAPRVVLWGDSHALMVLPAYKALAKSRGLQLRFAAISACRPLLPSASPAVGAVGDAHCAAFNLAMLAALRHIHPDVTILSAYWDLEGAQAGGNPAILSGKPALDSVSSWEWTASSIRATGSSVCVVLDVPRHPYVVPYALGMARRRNLDTDFLYTKRADVAARYSRLESSVRALAASNELRIADPKEVLCSAARCEIEFAGLPLYRDTNHLSVAGAMRVSSALARCLPGSAPDLPPIN